MYLKHFHLNQEPFSIAPDPSFLYLSEGHREALAHLLYGFSHGGFVLVTGEVGTGKTTLLRNLIKQTPQDLDVAFVLNPRLTVRELLETICDELGAQYKPEAQYSVKQYIDTLNRHLLQTHQAGRSTVLIIDEAQNLSPAVLEQLRLLTNLETDERKLLRIILLGQPELGEMLDRQELRQLAQRITARYHLGALSKEDSIAYIGHRLSRAGGHPGVFTSGAMQRLFRISKGIPRLLNVLADRAMLGAYVEGQHQVTASTVDNAAQEVLGRNTSYRPWLIGGAVAAAIFSGLIWILIATSGSSEPEPTPASTLTPPIANAIPAPTQAPPVVPATQPVASAPLETATVETAPIAGAGTIVRQTNTAVDPSLPPPSLARPASTIPGARPPDTEWAAFEALFKLWNVDFAQAYADEAPCDFAQTVGLACLNRKGRWSDLARLNLPVVLELWDQQEEPYFATVVGATSSQFLLNLGGQTFPVAPRDLRDIWLGSFTLLWHTPPDYPGNLRVGDKHSTVQHLRAQLSRLPDLGLQNSGSDTFDAPLETAVLRFQNREGLLADGIVGPATWIRLFHRLQEPGPALRG